jgi:hypothetical protein
MKNIKRLVMLLSLFSAAGITYTIVALKNMPNILDWSMDEGDEDES